MPAFAFWCWIAFLASWWGAAWWVARAASTAPLAGRLGWFAGFGVGFALLFGGQGRAFWATPAVPAAALALAELAGFAFAWWARVHLGRLWSGMMTLREGHRVVDTGPYALVRHPIYTGFIAAAWAFALLSGEPLRLAGAAALTAVMAAKSRAEERLLRRELGAAAYDAYAAHTPALLPRGLRAPPPRL